MVSGVGSSVKSREEAVHHILLARLIFVGFRIECIEFYHKVLNLRLF